MKKRHSAEQIVGLLRQADVDPGEGVTVADVGRRLGVSQQTHQLQPHDSQRQLPHRTALRNQTRRRITAAIAGIPAESSLFRLAAYALHCQAFVFRHRRWPGSPDREFNDFLFSRKVNGSLSDPLCRFVTDKEHGKTFIAERVGAHRTIPTVAILRSPREIDDFRADGWPLVAKPTHSSGRKAIIEDQQELSLAIPMMRDWLEHCYFRESLELNYRDLERKVIVERYLPDTFPFEGSIYCRDGQPRVISIVDRRTDDRTRVSLDGQGRPVHFALGRRYCPMPDPKLPYLETLMAEAAVLAERFAFIRVDFYGSPTDFLFGELTNLPAAALGRFDSPAGAAEFNGAFFAPLPLA
jgi:hypothetical protein